MEETRVKHIVTRFINIINTMPDNEETANILIAFFRQIHREKSDDDVLPNIEMMTVLKREKHMAYTIMRDFGNHDTFLGFLVQLDTDYEVAKSRLEFIVQ